MPRDKYNTLNEIIKTTNYDYNEALENLDYQFQPRIKVRKMKKEDNKGETKNVKNK